MTSPQAGWYPDPWQPGVAGALRYWDGIQWTEHAHQLPPAEQQPYQQPEQQAQPGGYPGYGAQGYGAQGYGAQGYGAQAATGIYDTTGRRSTPDGVPLAGWWMRVLAYLLDGLLMGLLVLLALIPLIASQWDQLTTWVDAVNEANRTGAPQPPSPDLVNFATGPGQLLLAITFGVNALYTIGFWRWKQATPGKLVLGLRIRRRQPPGGFPWDTIILRAGFILGLGLLAYVPVISVFAGLAILLDYLWPLWDGRRQALHDKVAGTNVVRDVQRHATSSGATQFTGGGAPPRW